MPAPAPLRLTSLDDRRFAPGHPAEALHATCDVVNCAIPTNKPPLRLRIAYITFATPLLTLILPQAVVVSDVSHVAPAAQLFPEARRVRSADAMANVWLVDRTGTDEVYSNGLRIENTYAIQNEHRFYQVLDRSDNMQPGNEWHSDPAGIIYHATESPQYPFDKAQNDNLRRVGRALASLVRDNRSYHFLIDRFGRVFRVVEETDAAHHAGNSVWADGRSVYLNLNNSFLGVAFETAAETHNGVSMLTDAQVFAGRNLTQMLRSKYRIPARNCVTHAQVSVNPINMRMGYHTDWAAMFPFGEMGLPDNYDLPVASFSDFGFDYDDTFRKTLGEHPWRGLTAAERQIERDSTAAGVSLDDYRTQLRERYKRLYSALKLTGALDEQPAR